MITSFSRIEDPHFSPFDLGNINIVKDASPLNNPPCKRNRPAKLQPRIRNERLS